MADTSLKTGSPSAMPYFWLGVLALIWGASFLFIKFAIRNGDMSPEVLALIRHFAGAATVGAVVAAQRKRVFSRTHWRRVPLFAAMAFLASVYPWTAIAWGELHISSGLASIFNATTPIWTALFAYWVTPLERPSRLNYVGVGIAFLGSAILVAPALLEHGLRGDVLGSLAVLSAAAGYAAGALFQRRKLSGVDTVEAALWQLMIGSVAMIVIASPTIPSAHLHFDSLAAAIALGVAASGFGYIIFYYLLNNLGGTRTSTVTFLLPVTAVFWGLVVLHEQVTVAMLVAMVVILAGVYLTTRRPRASRTEAAPASTAPLRGEDARIG